VADDPSSSVAAGPNSDSMETDPEVMANMSPNAPNDPAEPQVAHIGPDEATSTLPDLVALARTDGTSDAAVAVQRAREHYKLAEAATPGPWSQGMAGDRLIAEVDYSTAFGFVRIDGVLSDDGVNGVADATLIAALPEIVANERALADEVERLHAAIWKAYGILGFDTDGADRYSGHAWKPIDEFLVQFCTDERERMDEGDDESHALRAEVERLQGELARANRAFDDQVDSWYGLQAEIAALSAQRDACCEDLATAEASLRELQALVERAVTTYKHACAHTHAGRQWLADAHAALGNDIADVAGTGKQDVR
jgi:hypothetical protein